jgi:hypothetical protein
MLNVGAPRQRFARKQVTAETAVQEASESYGSLSAPKISRQALLRRAETA